MSWFKRSNQNTVSPSALTTSILYDETTFYKHFTRDLSAAQEEVIIESPFVSSKRMNGLRPVFEKLIKKGNIISPTNTPVIITPTTLSHASKCYATQIDLTNAEAFLPDSACTPGSINASVMQDNITSTICHSGYTTTIRSSVSYTNKLKEQQIIEYGYDDTNLKDYEKDHFISLELGGNPSDPKNLWPEPHASFNEKDKVENYLHEQVCSGMITLYEAQKEITANWYDVYKRIPK